MVVGLHGSDYVIAQKKHTAVKVGFVDYVDGQYRHTQTSVRVGVRGVYHDPPRPLEILPLPPGPCLSDTVDRGGLLDQRGHARAQSVEA